MHRRARDLDSVHVPLGLVERQERPKFDRTQEISPERWAAEQPEYTEKRVEHDAFLAEIGKHQPGEHMVILGEPGAGKTTLLTKVWEWLLEHEQPGEDIIVAWVPLAAVNDHKLKDYLKGAWLDLFCSDDDQVDNYWKSFLALAKAGRVWLLLDGADEMGGDALSKLEATLREAWTRSTRAIITCRLNLWDAISTNLLQTNPNFQVYRTLDFKYANPARQDEVKDFIDKWFLSTPVTGQKLRMALDEAGKERIKDLAQNPLRLSLLCDIWEEEDTLPDTQADLYQKFVNRFYKWSKFPELSKQRESLNRLMQGLAKYGLNKPSLHFRFTEAELQEQLVEVKSLDALKALGWLNCVGLDKSDDEVYAFFHPTFQEYFASCGIDDWDYFLPRAHADQPVPCLGEEKIGPTYRVFESEWRQPIVLWFGRGDVSDEDKEKFIEKSTTFQDGVGDFYYYRAYCMAAIGVGEFKSSRQAESIVQVITEWTFGHFDFDKQAWVNLAQVNHVLVSNTILLTQRQHLINSLRPILFQDNLPDNAKLFMDSIFARLHAIVILGKIANGNTQLIRELTSFIEKADNDLIKITTAEALGSIDSGNHLAISVMIDFIRRPSSTKYNVIFFVAQCLWRIAIENEEVFKALIDMLSQLKGTDDFRQSIIIRTLSEISVGHVESINVLITMLNSNTDPLILHSIEDAIIRITSKNKNIINTIKFKLSAININRHAENFISRILKKINDGENKEFASPRHLFLNLFTDFHSEKEILKSIKLKDKEAIKELSAIIPKLDKNNPRLLLAAYTLGRIDAGNSIAIKALITILLQSDLDDGLLHEVLHSLQKTAVGDKDTIKILLDFICKPELSNLLKYNAAYTLWLIDIGNDQAMTVLLDLFSTSNWDDSLPMGTGESWSKIITTEAIPKIISKLKYQIAVDMCEGCVSLSIEKN